MVHPLGKSRSTSTPTTPTATPTSTPTSPTESFIQKRLSTLHRGDIKALAASSFTVASSIGFPSFSEPYPPYSDEQRAPHTLHTPHPVIGQELSPHLAADSAWQTAYSAARMVIGVTKESSDMFLPLKAVVGALSVLIKNYDQTVSNVRQVEEIEERVMSLSDILRFPRREDDYLERTRREALYRKLMDIVVKLEPLSEQNGLLKFLRNEDHAGLLNGFVQDIAYAVTDYQISLQQSTYESARDIHEVTKGTREVTRDIDQTTKGIAESTANIVRRAEEITEASDLEVLDKLNPVHDAGYQADNHKRCLTGTREHILRDIMSWAKSTQDQPVFWLNGLAGTGKSTIAQTFSEMANDDDMLGASFFCSRDYLERKVLKNIFPTLGYQLACRYPRFRDHLLKAIKRDPSVAHNSLISQLRHLLVDPLSSTGISCVIVIDALDECVDDQPASAIISVLGRLVSKLPLVKFFITGRPEPRIRSGFRLPLLEPFTQIFLLHEVDPTSVEGDIRLYLTERLTAIAKRRSGLDLPQVWPSDEEITVLVRKSSGLFIFASTVARFIESEHHEPRERLRLIVSRVDDTSHEGASGVDSLYSQVLRDAFSGIYGGSVFANLKRILSAVVLALNPLSRDGLVKLLEIDSALISTTLRHLHSVLLVPTDGSKGIRVFHKSFPDFLQDLKRCTDPRFHIDFPTRHGDMALSCLALVGKLGVNPCTLSPFVMNQDVPDLPQLLKDKLGSGLRYACRHWSMHLLFSPTSGGYGNRLITSTSLFFNRSVFPWMEVMSLEGRLEDVIHSMNHLLDWWGKVGTIGGPIADLTTDCLRFTLHFFRPIQMSAQHIYHTALPLAPETSVLRRWFLKSRSSWEEDCTTRHASSSNLTTTWGSILRTIKADSGGFTHVAVAGKSIAAVCDGNTIDVYDAVTGVLRLSLNAPRGVTMAEGSLDGSILICARHRSREITLWDMQTGGLIHTFTMKFEINDIAVSSTGRYLASCSPDGTFRFWEVETGSGGSRFLGEPIVDICWLEPEDQAALAFKGSVVVLEVTTERTLHTFPVGESVRGIAFSPRQRRLAVWLTSGIESTIKVISIQTGLVLVSSPPLLHVSRFTFSGDGDRIVCATKAGNLLFLPVTITLTSWRDCPHQPGTIHSICHLRSGHLVVGVGDCIQLLAMEYVQPSRIGLDPEVSISHVYPLDNGKAVCTSSRDRGDVSLLDVETMKTLASYGLTPRDIDPSLVPRILCASINRRTTILNFPKHHDGEFHLIRSVFPGWRISLPQPVTLVALSPGGGGIVVVEESASGGWQFRVVKTLDGKTLFSAIQAGRPPKTIVFTSGTEFYTEYEDEDRRVTRCVRSTFVLNPRLPTDMIRKLSEESVLSTHPYELDENLEWVIDAKSRRVCWLPPGYVSGTENGHCFAGSSIVMAGEDGIVRRLTFTEPRSDS